MSIPAPSAAASAPLPVASIPPRTERLHAGFLWGFVGVLAFSFTLPAMRLAMGHEQAVREGMELDVRHQRIAGLRVQIEQQLVTDGQMIVTKDSGMFIARRS